MTGNGVNFYKTCRRQAGLTQERAAELLNVSQRALARYEAGEVNVPDDVAYAMVRLYNSQFLAVEHLRQVSQIAAEVIPAVDECDMQQAAIRLYNCIMDFVDHHPDRQLLRIVEDNVITEEERPVLESILAELSRITKICTEVRLATKKEENQ